MCLSVDVSTSKRATFPCHRISYWSHACTRDKVWTYVMLFFPSLMNILLLTFLINYWFLLTSCKYAAHCSLIASRFGLPSFVHPPPVPVKAEGKHCRLRVGYVFEKSCMSCFWRTPNSIVIDSLVNISDMLAAILGIIPSPISWVQYLECMTVTMLRLFHLLSLSL